MYVGGPLDTAPATSSSTLSRSQASHREVKVRKVNPSHSVSPPVLEYREVDRIATETGLQGLDHPEGNYPLSLSVYLHFGKRFSFRTFVILAVIGRPRSSYMECTVVRAVFRQRVRWSCDAASYEPNFKLNTIRPAREVETIQSERILARATRFYAEQKRF